jgi:ABC-2 type transport system permease protein
MSTQPEIPSKQIRPFYWSVRRELWENRSLYLAPLIVAGVIVIGFMFSAIGLAERRRAVLLLDDPLKTRTAIEMPYSMAAMMIMFTAFIVAVFYCLDALHGERRERSILFWKSLPVSDFTTVLSKAVVAFVVMPLITCAVVILTQLMIFLISSVVLLVHGVSPATTLVHTHYFLNTLLFIYGIVVLTIWHIPTYSWMLLVSGWARRAAFLWAILPWVAIMFFERITFGTVYFYSFIKYRFGSPATTAFNFPDPKHPCLDTLSQLTLGRYLTTPGVWIGLAFGVAFLAIAIRMRRYRGPM